MTTRRPSRLWRATGWHLGTGQVIEWSINLPSGIHAKVVRQDPSSLDWIWQIGGTERDIVNSMVSCADAKRMAEEFLARHVRKALRMLRP